MSYQICTNCIMDTTDPTIKFDENGVCHHCHDFNESVKPNWHTDERGQKELNKIIEKIKESGKGKKFNCLLGMSGGMDSSYMLHMAVTKWGLNPLVFHVDAGWNSEMAVKNINAMVNKLNVELHTEVMNWDEMRDFQLTFFKSGIRELDIPQDHAFIAMVDKFAEKFKIKFILNGGNFSTECVMPPREWLYYGTDMNLINDIIKKFSTVKMETYPFVSVMKHKLYLKYLKGIHNIKPLNYIPYVKKDVIKVLKENYGWQEYPQKHFESIFTKFFEGYWLPEKFGIDMRRIQLSSLILTGQMSRDEALNIVSNPAYDAEKIEEDFEFIAQKLQISAEELKGYFDAPNKSFRDYKNSEWFFLLGSKIMKAVGLERAVRR
ncbi:MAG: N-acetyl sugar amidotransferase [bacterium]